MTIELSDMNLQELVAHRGLVDETITKRKEDEKAQVLSDMKALAEDRGFDFSEIIGGKKPRRKIEPKYRNPEDTTQTWTGMGRKPKWLVAELEAGKSIDGFKI